MSDFQKEKAIYTWMYELGNAYIINGWNECPELDDEIFDRKVTKTLMVF